MLQLIFNPVQTKRQELGNRLRRLDPSQARNKLAERANRVCFGVRGRIVENEL